MVEPAPRGPQRIRRRDALRLLAASSGAVAGGSLIVSGPAHADIGSEPCLFAFTGSPVVTISAFNTSFIGDFVTLTMSAVPGSCGCGGAPSIEYAFHLIAPLATATSGAWSTTNSYSLSFANLWPGAGGPFTVSAGVRVTCTVASGTTVRCRFASGLYNMPASFGRVSETLSLPTNNGNSPIPNLPPCNAAAARFAALRTDDVMMMVPGVAASPPELQALIAGAPEQQPIDVLAEQPQPDAAQPSADDAVTETTTEPTPQATPSTTTPSTTTPTTTTSTTISDPTTTSTTTPPTPAE